jgi:hypothetical protein
MNPLTEQAFDCCITFVKFDLYMVHLRIWLEMLYMSDPEDGANSKEEQDIETKRKMSQAPGAIMRQSRLLASLSGVTIGFLLSISVSSPSNLSFANYFSLVIAIFSATIAANLFILPSVFYHIPPRWINLEIFENASQRFILFGIIALSITFYLCLEVSFSSLLGIETAFGVAAIPFVLAYSIFLAEVRKMKKRFKKR